MNAPAPSPLRLAWSAPIGPGLPRAPRSPIATPVDDFVERVQMLERAGVEFVLVGESVRPGLGPAPLVTRLAMHTTTLGFVAELAMSDYPPFKLARLFATVGHLTGGRVGWGVDTSLTPRGAWNFRLDEVPAEESRWAIADEYVQVVRGIWGTWQPGALIEDAATGIFADPAKVRPLDHDGTWFRSKGPLNIIPPDRGTLLVHRAAGEDGYRFAGRHADVAVVGATSIDELGKARHLVAEAAVDGGRRAEDVKVYAAVNLRVARTAGALGHWPTAPATGITLAGAPEAVADGVEEVHDATEVDGVLVQGDWDPAHVTAVCQRVVAELRRRGRVQGPPDGSGLRATVLG